MRCDTEMLCPESSEKRKKPGGLMATGRVEFRKTLISAPFDGLQLLNLHPIDFHVMNLRQYSVLGQAHGVCGWYNR